MNFLKIPLQCSWMTHMAGSSTSFIVQLTTICRPYSRSKKKLNLIGPFILGISSLIMAIIRPTTGQASILAGQTLRSWSETLQLKHLKMILSSHLNTCITSTIRIRVNFTHSIKFIPKQSRWWMNWWQHLRITILSLVPLLLMWSWMRLQLFKISKANNLTWFQTLW